MLILKKLLEKNWKNPLRPILISNGILVVFIVLLIFYIYPNTKLSLILHDNNEKNYFENTKLSLNATIEMFTFKDF